MKPFSRAKYYRFNGILQNLVLPIRIMVRTIPLDLPLVCAPRGHPPQPHRLVRAAAANDDVRIGLGALRSTVGRRAVRRTRHRDARHPRSVAVEHQLLLLRHMLWLFAGLPGLPRLPGDLPQPDRGSPVGRNEKNAAEKRG